MNGTVTGRHSYADPATYQISLAVVDDDAAEHVVDRSVDVADPEGAVVIVIDELIPFAGTDPNIEAALDKLRGNRGGQAHNGALDKLQRGQLRAAQVKVEQATEYLRAAALPPDLSHVIHMLVLTARSIGLERDLQ